MSQIVIGKSGRENVGFDLDVLLRTRLLIQANSGGGKSWLLRRLAEQLSGKVPTIIIDPEGEFPSLREKFPFVLVGKGGETPADVRSAALVAQKLLQLRASAVIDIFEMKPADRHEYVRRFLDSLIDAPKAFWRKTAVIVDEAQMFCPEHGKGESVASEAMKSLTSRGRKRRFCAMFATQRLAFLNKDASALLLNRLVGMTFEDVDLVRALDVLSIDSPEKHEMRLKLKNLDPGQFFSFGRALGKERLLLQVGPVQTTHPDINDVDADAPPPPSPDKIRSMLPKLADLPKAAEEKAATEAELRAQIRSMRMELAAAKRAATSTAPAPAPRPPKVEIKTVPILKDSQITRLEKISERVGKYGADLVEQAKALGQNLATTKKALSAPTLPAVRSIMPPRPRTIAQAPARIHAPPAIHDAADDGTLQMTRRRQQILDALAWLESVGVMHANKKQTALLADASPSSSGYTNNLGALRVANLISYPSSGNVALTAEGRSRAAVPEAPPTTDDLHKALYGKLSQPQSAIIKALIAIYPESISKPDLAEKAGASFTSSGFTNNLGSLRSLGFIDYPSSGHVVALPVLFLEEATA